MDQVTLARREIESFPEVEDVRYVSKTEALFNASRDLPEFSDVFSDLDVNPLPASMRERDGRVRDHRYGVNRQDRGGVLVL